MNKFEKRKNTIGCLQVPKNFLNGKTPLYTLIYSLGVIHSIMSEEQSRYQVFDYIRNRTTCDGSCAYSSFCPSMPSGVIAEDCIIRRDHAKVFDTFYNLYFGNLDGLRSEMIGISYMLKEQCFTPEEYLQYFNSLVKIMSACYAPEKSQKDDFITDVLINITPLEPKKRDTK